MDHVLERRENDYWKIKPKENCFISNFNYPIITTKDKFDGLIKSLSDNGVETRPLICGSINQQPFWYEKYGMSDTPNADYFNSTPPQTRDVENPKYKGKVMLYPKSTIEQFFSTPQIKHFTIIPLIFIDK